MRAEIMPLPEDDRQAAPRGRLESGGAGGNNPQLLRAATETADARQAGPKGLLESGGAGGNNPQLLRAATAPPSKSMAHRLLICAALTQGGSRVANLAHSADIDATAEALRALGAGVDWQGDTARVMGAPPVVSGREAAGDPSQPGPSVNCRESGSTLRFLIPLFAMRGGETLFTGAPRLFQRPLGAYADIFRAQGLPFQLLPDGSGLRVGGPLHGGACTLPGDVSSQFVTGLLLALPLLPGESTLRIAPPVESRAYIDLTRHAQRQFGVFTNLDVEPDGTLVLQIPGGQPYRRANTLVEGDWSQAAVFAAIAAAGGAGAGVDVAGLDVRSFQGDRIILDILRACGARAGFEGGALHIRPPADGPLVTPGDIDLSPCPDLGPILCALALFCRGTTRLVNAGRLRLKESDRIATVQAELQKLGGRITSTADTVTIEGGHPLHTATLHAHSDHRVVMAAAAAALCAHIPVAIEGAEAVAKSWPTFFEDLAALGATVQKQG